ncbi:MAG: hypothetical protein QXI40_07410, partial [Ignisphaera sp.]
MNLNRYSEDEVDNEFIEFVAPIATRHSSSDEAVESIASDRGPRSRVVEAILLLLYVKPMKSSEIAKILNKS